jgi:hypothetical protein
MVITAENQRKIFFAGGWNGRSFIDDVDVLTMRKYHIIIVVYEF